MTNPKIGEWAFLSTFWAQNNCSSGLGFGMSVHFIQWLQCPKMTLSVVKCPLPVLSCGQSWFAGREKESWSHFNIILHLHFASWNNEFLSGWHFENEAFGGGPFQSSFVDRMFNCRSPSSEGTFVMSMNVLEMVLCHRSFMVLNQVTHSTKLFRKEVVPGCSIWLKMKKAISTIHFCSNQELSWAINRTLLFAWLVLLCSTVVSDEIIWSLSLLESLIHHTLLINFLLTSLFWDKKLWIFFWGVFGELDQKNIWCQALIWFPQNCFVKPEALMSQNSCPEKLAGCLASTFDTQFILLQKGLEILVISAGLVLFISDDLVWSPLLMEGWSDRSFEAKWKGGIFAGLMMRFFCNAMCSAALH